MQQLQPNTLLQGGKYRIEKVLGQGGFGITYLAYQEMLDRHVCIKEFFFKSYCERAEDATTVTLGTSGSAELVQKFKAKFLKEAKTISKLSHPNIVSILDIFEENSTAYYVMEYIEGRSLSEFVHANGAMNEETAISYVEKVGAALSYIHKQNITHLDVKPANIMVREANNEPILIDFGLAKQYDAETGNQTSTTPLGISQGYAPIEQYTGVAEFSPQTDIYSLGATLYKLVTGITPPQPTDLIDNSLNFGGNVSPVVKKAISKAMKMSKNARPQSVEEFLEMLKKGPISSDRSTTVKVSASPDDEKTVLISGKGEPPSGKTAKAKEEPSDYSDEIEEECRTPLWKKLGLAGLIITGIIVFFVVKACNDTNPTQQITPTEVADSIPDEPEAKVYDVVEQMPSFPGGDNALMAYLSTNVTYPLQAQENGIEGRVVVSFIVETDGSISDVRVVRSVDSSLDNEAVRVVKSMPNWEPGRQNGEPARVKYNVPISFKLQ